MAKKQNDEFVVSAFFLSRSSITFKFAKSLNIVLDSLLDEIIPLTILAFEQKSISVSHGEMQVFSDSDSNESVEVDSDGKEKRRRGRDDGGPIREENQNERLIDRVEAAQPAVGIVEE